MAEGISVVEARRQVARDPMLCWDRQRIRDVPRSCICPWVWGRPMLRWVRLSTQLGCPWHSRAPWVELMEMYKRVAETRDQQ